MPLGKSSKKGETQQIPYYLSATYSYRTKVKVRRTDSRRILRNVCLVSIAFMLLFTANQGVINLQSTINPESGIIGLAVIYISLGISCLVLPTFLIKKLGAKYVLALGMSCFFPFILFQLYPKHYTLIPSGIILGFGAAPLWSGLSTYLTHTAQVYATIQNVEVDTTIVRFFGIFYFGWQSADVWGNLISSLVIADDDSSEVNNTQLLNCGSQFCPIYKISNNVPTKNEILKIIMIYLPCLIGALTITLVVIDPLQRYGENREGATNPADLSTRKLLLSTFRIMTRANLMLLIPITIWNGMQQGFIAADFTKSFVSCILGANKIGYVMMGYGLTDAIGCLTFGYVMKFSGRVPLIILGGSIHISVYAVLLQWHPDFGGPLTLYVLACFYGLGDSVWQTQLNGLYGTLFRRHKEAAFANYRLWESIGFAITYINASLYCTDIKIYSLLSMLVFGLLGYIAMEIRYVIKDKGISLAIQRSPDVTPANPLSTKLDEAIEIEDDDEIDYLEADIVVTNM